MVRRLKPAEIGLVIGMPPELTRPPVRLLQRWRTLASALWRVKASGSKRAQISPAWLSPGHTYKIEMIACFGQRCRTATAADFRRLGADRGPIARPRRDRRSVRYPP